MKIKRGNLLTVILSLLCAAALALGIGFLLPKAEKITADAAVSPSGVTATFTDGGVSKTYNQPQAMGNPTSVSGGSMSPGGSSFGTGTNTSTTNFSRTGWVSDFDMWYAGGYATVNVPAHTEYKLKFDASITITRLCPSGAVSKVQSYGEVLYYGSSADTPAGSDMSSSTNFYISSPTSYKIASCSISPSSQVANKTSTDTESKNITVTNNTDSNKDFYFYFGVRANTNSQASGTSNFTASATISLDTLSVQVTSLDAPKVTSANNVTPTDDATETYMSLGNVFTFDYLNTGKAFHNTTDECVELKSIFYTASGASPVNVTSTYSINSSNQCTLSDVGKYVFTFGLTATCGAVWDSSTNDQNNKTVTITIKQAELEITTTPTAPSSGYQWELGATGSLALNVTTSDSSPTYDLDYYYVNTSNPATQLTTGLNTTTGALDVSQITSTGTYKLCIKLKSTDDVPANKNYTIKDATAGIYEIPFTIGAGAIDFSVIDWQYSEETATNPPYSLFVAGSQQTLLYKYNETTHSTLQYYITAEIPASAGSYLSIDTTYNGSYNGNSFNCGFYTEYLGVDGTSTPVPVLYADKAGRYKTLIVLDTDTNHLFTNDTNYGPLNTACTKGWYEVNWTVNKATIAQTSLAELNKHLQWRIPAETGWQDFDPAITTLAFCGKEIEVQVDPSVYPHGITGVDTTYGTNGYTNAKGTNGNTYTATVKYTVDDSYNSVAVQTFTWTIDSLILNPQVTNYTYSGGEVDLKTLLNLTNDQWDFVTVSSGTSKATDVGQYTATLTIKPAYFGGVVWNTSSIAPTKKTVRYALTAVSASADCTVKWEILKATVTAVWGDAEKENSVPPVSMSSASVANVPNELLVFTYRDVETGQTVAANKLKGGHEYDVTVGLNPDDPRSNNYTFNAPAAYRIKTAETGPNIWQKIGSFMTQNAMGLPMWAWLLIALAVLILLIIIIAVCVKRRKTKEEREAKKAAKEEERLRREEERRLQQERLEEERRLQREKLEAEREMARAKQEAELEKTRAQAQAGMAGAGMATMAMQQPMQQPIPQPVQQVMPQPVQYAQPQMQSMPMQQQMPQSYGGGIMERVVAELAAIREEHKSKTEAELANAKLLVEFERLRGDMRQYGGTPVTHMSNGVAGNAIPADVVIALIEAVKSGNPAPVNINTAPAALPQSVEESAPVQASVQPAIYPADAVITTTTTVDTTKDSKSERSIRRDDSSDFIDVDGFYDTFDM